jgi:hypothetical protein
MVAQQFVSHRFRDDDFVEELGQEALFTTVRSAVSGEGSDTTIIARRGIQRGFDRQIKRPQKAAARASVLGGGALGKPCLSRFARDGTAGSGEQVSCRQLALSSGREFQFAAAGGALLS